ncbi:MAG TPA: hypothetical protein VIC24_06240 [Gemmatimonadaceae bacterium]
MRDRTNRPRPNADPHPDEGEMRAYLDGELTRFRSMRLALHMSRCQSCALMVADLRSLDARATSLLGAFMPTPAQRPPRRRRRIGLGVASVAGPVAAVVLWLAAVPTTHASASGAYRVHDVCCFNLDGGEHADDGMLTVSRPGEVVDCVLLYEDRAGLRRFAQRDPLRFAGGGRTAPTCAPSLVAEVQASVAAFRGKS